MQPQKVRSEGGMSEEFFNHTINFLKGFSGHDPCQHGFGNKFCFKIRSAEFSQRVCQLAPQKGVVPAEGTCEGCRCGCIPEHRLMPAGIVLQLIADAAEHRLNGIGGGADGPDRIGAVLPVCQHAFG